MARAKKKECVHPERDEVLIKDLTLRKTKTSF